LKPWGKRRRRSRCGVRATKSSLRRRSYWILVFLFNVSIVVHRLMALQSFALTVEELEKSRYEVG
jgi:predicted CDP-diglyceride synthetase/phosphatidate cytidylyltransferase